MTGYFPTHEGLLPKWLFLISVVSTLNSLQAYRSTDYVRQLFAGSPATNNQSPANPHSARTFGTWTFLSAVVRMYAAYNISNPAVYDLAIWTYGIALGHFVTEWLGYGSAQLKGRFLSPFLVASATVAWMFTQRTFYLA